MLVHSSPKDLVYRVLSTDWAYYLLDVVAAVDNMTTGLGYMEYACEVSLAAGKNCWLHSVFGGMAMNCGGAFIRHFVNRGYTRGVSTLRDLLPNLRVSFLCTCTYYWLALQGRTTANFAAKAAANGCAWQIVTWLMVAINCLPPVGTAHAALWDGVAALLSKAGAIAGVRLFDGPQVAEIL